MIEQDEDGTFIASFVEIDDLFAAGEQPGAALEALAIDLIEYSHEYMSDKFEL
jgi:predicted RNase H-like HicB family nuclease